MATETRLTVGSLFAGIGGFDLGFERAGCKTVWQVEIDEYCRKVLARHFPDAKRFADIRECVALDKCDWDCPDQPTHYHLESVDIVCGGFPCQDISECGARVGFGGERSGLWAEMFRLVRELTPRFVAIENVAALLTNGMDVVISDLSSIGYDAEWEVIPACAFGAPHIRERVWIVAYPAQFSRLHESRNRNLRAIFDGDSLRKIASHTSWPDAPHPVLCGVDDGIPNRVDRHEAVGNGLVPQIAHWIAERIKQVITEFPAQPCTDEVASGVE